MKAKKVARLARIEVSKSNEDAYDRDLLRILEQMSLIEGATSNTADGGSMENTDCALREDVTVESGIGLEVFKQAPDRFEDYFRVPRFVSDDKKRISTSPPFFPY